MLILLKFSLVLIFLTRSISQIYDGKQDGCAWKPPIEITPVEKNEGCSWSPPAETPPVKNDGCSWSPPVEPPPVKTDCAWRPPVKQDGCKLLEPVFKYTQEDAPKDVSAVVALMTSKVNRELTRVTKIEVRQSDQSQRFPLGQVGEHLMIATVQRIDDYGNVEELCFHVVFQISDIDECSLPKSNPLASRCHESLDCINTQGSYECRCRGEAIGLPGGMGQCLGSVDTNCCSSGLNNYLGKKDLEACKAAFRCTESVCPGDCVPEATCTASKDGRSHTCTCRAPYVGNGHACRGDKPVVWQSKLGAIISQGVSNSGALVTRGSSARDHCEWNAGFCGCTLPKVDHCHEVSCGANAVCINLGNDFRCECLEGFTRLQGMGCAQMKVPTLRLIGPERMILKQCDSYFEQGVEIFDQNEETQTRTVDIEYSEPLGICMRKMGNFHVNYTLQTPWATRPFTRVTRYVEVGDVDECTLPQKIASECPECAPKCLAPSSCTNTIGSYLCKCPFCMEGDGFTGCRDNCAPVITLPEQPYYFRMIQCFDLLGQRICTRDCNDYQNDLNKLLKQTNGKFLCPGGQACVRATDNNGLRTLDITEKVTIGAAIPISVATDGQCAFGSPKAGPEECVFHVPYDVVDEAGNRAKTAFRKVIVQELPRTEPFDCNSCPK